MGRRRHARSDIYHVMSRGSGKQIIFEDNGDRQRYLDLLKTVFSADGGASLLAWCLMDNHVHLLVSGELVNISDAMRALNSSYAMYFNKRYGHVGHVFQGRYKSVPVESDEQLLAVIRYIHQNPWKAGYSEGCDYPWSSYGAYLRGCFEEGPISGLMNMFGGVERFVDFHARLDKSQDTLVRGANVRRGRKTMPIALAIEIARDALDGDDPETVSGLPRGKRNRAIARLGAAGLSVRQIERMTGVPKSTVARLLGRN